MSCAGAAKAKGAGWGAAESGAADGLGLRVLVLT